MKRLYRIIMSLMVALAAEAFMVVAEADDAIEVAVAESRAVSVDGGIQLSATDNVRFEIYSITGQRVKVMSVENSTVKVDLPKGCYIVRCAQWSKKVVVK